MEREKRGYGVSRTRGKTNVYDEGNGHGQVLHETTRTEDWWNDTEGLQIQTERDAGTYNQDFPHDVDALSGCLRFMSIFEWLHGIHMALGALSGTRGVAEINHNLRGMHHPKGFKARGWQSGDVMYGPLPRDPDVILPLSDMPQKRRLDGCLVWGLRLGASGLAIKYIGLDFAREVRNNLNSSPKFENNPPALVMDASVDSQGNPVDPNRIHPLFRGFLGKIQDENESPLEPILPVGVDPNYGLEVRDDPSESPDNPIFSGNEATSGSGGGNPDVGPPPELPLCGDTNFLLKGTNMCGDGGGIATQMCLKPGGDATLESLKIDPDGTGEYSGGGVETYSVQCP